MRLLTEPQQVLETLARTVAHQEDGRAEPWRMANLPESYVAGMAKNVMAVELLVQRVDGKFKLGQNMPEADRKGAIAGLLAEGNAMSEDTADAMARTLDGDSAAH